MTAKIISTQKTKKILFHSSPCVVTMKNWNMPENDSLSQKGLAIKKNCDVFISDGIVREIGENLLTKYEHQPDIEIIDASRLVLMPGLIDCHNHPVFAGSRANETVQKSQGMTYEDIAAAGGGILATVRATRKMDQKNLAASFKNHAKNALQRGVVLLEAKTGYGLNPVEERKMLEALYHTYADASDRDELPALVPTYLGPHAASPDYQGLDSYIHALIEDLPNIAALSDAAVKMGIAFPLAADIFLERNYFTKDQSERWLNAALQHGLDVHIHSDEFSRSGGAELAIELARRCEQTATKKREKGRVLTIDHCQYSTESDFGRLAALGVTAVALPATSFFSRIPYVEAKNWRASGIRVAIATDFNPGTAPVNNIWFACYLALSQCRFSLAEVYAGVTINAAHALGVENIYGTLEEGKKATLVAFEGESTEDFFSSPIGDHVRYVVK